MFKYIIIFSVPAWSSVELRKRVTEAASIPGHTKFLKKCPKFPVNAICSCFPFPRRSAEVAVELQAQVREGNQLPSAALNFYL